MERECKKCGTVLELSALNFRPSPANKGGFRRQCRDCERAQGRKYAQSEEGRKTNAEYQKRWRTDNPDYRKQWLAANPSYARDWLEKQPNGYSSQWYKKWRASLSPEERSMRDKVHTARKREKKTNAGGSFTKTDLAKALAGQKLLCWWCGVGIKGGYHADHRIPLARGGTNGPENIVLSCPPCNLKKGKRMPWEMKENPRLL